MKEDSTKTKKVDFNGVRTWIEIEKKAVGNNYRAFRKIIGNEVKLLAVVKSNAYGHGLVDFAKTVEGLGADFLAVDSIVEALALRKVGIRIPILVLGYTLPEMIERAVNENISVTVSNIDSLQDITKTRFSNLLKIHLKVDTGMHRQGFQINEIGKVIEILKKYRNRFLVEGLYTHFAAAKNPSFPQYTNKQASEFADWINKIESVGFKPIKHAAATSATILFPKTHFDMVRVGIGLYGLWPSKEVKLFAEDKMELKPVLSWKTVVGEVKTLQAGSRIGYDLTEEFPKGGKIAICPIGYWHGYPRLLSSIGKVLVKGEKSKIIGRVSMDMIIVDISKIKNVKAGDEVVLIGMLGKEKVTADELGSLSDTVNYEIVTRLNPLIRRIYK